MSSIDVLSLAKAVSVAGERVDFATAEHLYCQVRDFSRRSDSLLATTWITQKPRTDAKLQLCSSLRVRYQTIKNRQPA
jgi:hypothetical protein